MTRLKMLPARENMLSEETNKRQNLTKQENESKARLFLTRQLDD